MRLFPRRHSRSHEAGPAGRRSRDPLGSGVWRRTYDDCASAARRSVPLLPAGSAARVEQALAEVLAASRAAARRWPVDGLDVPADPEARAAYDALRAAGRAFREVAYRVSLLARGIGTTEQEPLLERAFAAMDEAITRLVVPSPGPDAS